MKRDFEWLMEGPAWVRYRAGTELLGLPESDAGMKRARQEMLRAPEVKALLGQLKRWPGKALTSHKASDHLLHKLAFAADLGVRASDPDVGDILKRIAAHVSGDGMVQLLLNVPAHFGGSGKDQWTWMLCDAPSILYALGKMGHPRKGIQPGAEVITGLAADGGWPCAVAPELGKFRGPGRKDDPCPYANLAAIKALMSTPAGMNGEAVRKGAESILAAWARRRTYHPYIFYMGTDFCKLKAPLVWYDLLHVLDVLSRLPWLAKDKRLREMGGILLKKGDINGRFTAESVWMPWKGWEFGQKKEPSRWITAIAYGILDRLNIKS
jgi:hypothetical protein